MSYNNSIASHLFTTESQDSYPYNKASRYTIFNLVAGVLYLGLH